MALETVIIIFLFFVGLFVAYWIGHKTGSFRRDKFWEEEVKLHRKDAILKSRAVLGGHFSEQLAPFLPDFKYLPTECRFMGKPVDLIVFKGMDKKEIEEVVFVEVKSGNSKLSSVEKSLKNAIEKNKVRFEEYRVPEKITNHPSEDTLRDDN